jgi:hypothetical protein
MGKYNESHSDLWSTLGVKLNLPVKKCIEIAADRCCVRSVIGRRKDTPQEK